MLKHLNKLYLQSNSLTKINSNQLSNMPSLEKLDLCNNQISFIENNSFSSLIQLNYLCLQSNKIKVIESFAFEFIKIENISIKNQYLEKLNSYSFYQMSELLNLDLI